MKVGFMRCSLFLFAAAASLSGCFGGSPNYAFIQMEGVEAKGPLSGDEEQVDFIDINPGMLPNAQTHDLQVEFHSGRRLKFTAITEDLLKEIGTPSTLFYAARPDETLYFLDGYSFEFKRGQFTRLEMNLYGFPPTETTAFVKLGSVANGQWLSLPCSTQKLKDVFREPFAVSRVIMH